MLGFVVGAHQQLGDQSHQDGLKTQDKEHCAHLE